jgi:hypothetical protein
MIIDGVKIPWTVECALNAAMAIVRSTRPDDVLPFRVMENIMNFSEQMANIRRVDMEPSKLPSDYDRSYRSR